MKKLLSLALLVAIAVPVVRSVAPALAVESAPQAEFYMVDTGDNNPNLPGDCNSAGQRFGWSSQVRDTINNDNSDCAKVRIANPADRYSEDFRICFNLGSGWDETTRCTPWASEGGGGTGIRASYYDWAIGYMQNWTETRPLVNGGYVQDVRIGLQWYELPDRGSCGASGGLAWASANGGESPWTHGGYRDNDPGCAQMYLEANYVAPYRTAYAGSNLENATLDPARAYGADSNFRVTMRNEGHAWASSDLVRQEGSCDNYEPGEGVQPCSFTKVFASPNIKLAVTDPAGFQFSGNALRYERLVTVTHRSQMVTVCIPDGSYRAPSYPAGGGYDQPQMEQQLMNAIGIETANAAIREPIDPEPQDPPCTPTQEWVEVVTQAPETAVFAPATADFPLSFTTPGPGTYSIGFRMQKTDGAAAGTDGNGFFGSEVRVPVTVRDDGGPRVGISCPVAELTVQQGETASYAVSVASQGGFAGQVGIGVSGLPAGATSPGASATVPANGSAAAIVPVVTGASTPAGTSVLTFTATPSQQGVAPANCTSVLTVQEGGGAATLEIRPGSATVNIGSTAQFSAFFDADGPSGPIQPVNVSAQASWSHAPTEPAFNEGDGLFRGARAGQTVVSATYTQDSVQQNRISRSATANLTVSNVTCQPGDPGCVCPSGDPSCPCPVTDPTCQCPASDPNCPPGGNGLRAALSLSTDESSWQPSLTRPAPLTGVDLRAQSNATTSDVTYTFYCNRSDSGTDVTAGYARQSTGGSERVEANACSYQQPGTYVAKVIAVRGSERAESRATVTVGPTTTTGSCSFTATPGSLFIPPSRPTTLSWQCDHPTTCAVTNVTDGGTVASGNETGSGQHSPSHTTTYRLTCDNGGTIIDKLVRVFDVTTRIEILPR